MTDDQRPVWAARLQAEREQRGWSKREMARRLYRAAGIENGNVTSLARQVSWWEEGKHFPRDWASAYASAYGIPDKDLFAATPAEDSALPMLLSRPPTGTSRPEPPSVAHVESLLARLYRLDDAFGGNELCLVIADQVKTASVLLASASPTIERRLHSALAGLTQMAGWLSIDANRHSDANRYLTATMYAAHEADDLALAAHALGYMSLHAFYRDQPRKALSLAITAVGIAQAVGTPRTQAVLHSRAARAHARLGDTDASRRQLALAQLAYLSDADAPDPQWIAYVNDIEVTAQAGACYLDLGLAREAVTALTEAIDLVETAAPDHVRDLVHYKTRLAAAHLVADNPEEAAVIAGEAHRLAVQIGSARVSERFGELITQMEPYDVPAVRELVEQVRAG